MNQSPVIEEIGIYFLSLSLMAIGGANAVIPDMYREFVQARHWLSGTEFVELVALAQIAPGPNVLLVTLLGWQLAGLSGALLATAAMCLPTSLLTYVFAHYWQRFRHTRWHAMVREGLAPITVGLVMASGYVLADAADHNWAAWGITAVTVIFVVGTRMHPLWLLGIAGLLGFAGFA